MIVFTPSTSDRDLSGIIDLQKKNLPANLTIDEIKEQGFVTVSHSFDDLKKMHSYEQNILVKDDDKVAGYLLAMTKHSKADIHILIPMFDIFDRITYKGNQVSAYNYLVVGQVCIDKNYRGQGLLDKCYEAYREHFKKKYDFAITEIATTNQRSVNAHKRIGFSEIHKYTDLNKVEWSIVVWDWSNG